MEFAHFTTTAAAQWARWDGRNIDVSNDALGLATEPSIEYTNLRVNAAAISIDRDSSVVLLTPDGDVRWYGPETETDEGIWKNGDDETVADPRAICVVGDHIYVADGETGDLVLISRRGGHVGGRLAAGLDNPLDIIHSDRHVFILDGGTDETRGRVLALHPNGGVETVIRGLDEPTDIAADSSNIYLIERPDDTSVIRIHDAGHLTSPSIIPTSRTIDALTDPETDEPVIPVRIEVLTDQELVLIGRSPETDELALYHYTLERQGGRLERRDDFPLTCEELKTGPRDQDRRFPKSYAIAGEQRHVYIIDERQAHRRNPYDERYSAQGFRRIDAGTIDASWNRITLSFESFPSNTQVVTSYFASNDRTAGNPLEAIDALSTDDVEALRAAGIDGAWDLLGHDPRVIAGMIDATTDDVEGWLSESIDALDGEAWRTTGSANQRDILLAEAEGRYLFVKLELLGDVYASPEIDAFRAYCPRQSYLRYLPEYFQRRNGSGQFLPRYLSVFESEFVDIEEAIEDITHLFDPEGVPNDSLDWLADWLAIEYDEEWPERAKRDLLAQAPTLFRLRGTKAGITRTIQLYLDHVEAPNTAWMTEWQKRRIDARRADGRISDDEVAASLRRIDDRAAGFPDTHLLFAIEHLDLDELTEEAAREPYTMHMAGPRSFVVFAGPFIEASHLDAVRRIVESERPAHTHGRVVELRQELKLEGGSFLGINSTLTTREFVLGRSTLGGDSVLRDRQSFA